MPAACVVQAGEGRKTAEKPLAMQAMINRGWTPLNLRIVRLFMIAAGKARKNRWHDRDGLRGYPDRRLDPRARRPANRAGRKAQPWANVPNASTEVVMADNEILASASGRTRSCEVVHA